MTAADHDGVGKNVTDERFRAVRGAKHRHDRFGMAVADPFRTALAEADRVHERLDRRQPRRSIGARGLKNGLHAAVVERFIVERRQHSGHFHAVDPALVQVGQT